MNRRQFSSGLLGAAGALGLNRLAKGTPPDQPSRVVGPSQVRLTFAGLIVFHPKNRMLELGILRARNLGGDMPDHIFAITILNPVTGAIIQQHDTDLESYVQGGDTKWSLNVTSSNGNAITGVQAALQKPSDRHNSNQNKDDFGWITNIENNELHGKKLTRQPNKLLPLISLNYGLLHTTCKTESVDLYRGGIIHKKDFGFLAGATRLDIDTSNGEKVVLQTERHGDILRLTQGVSYDIEILNSPRRQPQNGLTKPTPPAPHFLLYYDLLFPGVKPEKRFSFDLASGTPPPDDPCPMIHPRDPEPYKCGGIMINETSGDLT